DFSGAWMFDAAKSNGKPEPVSLAGGEAPDVAPDGQVAGGRGRAGGGGAGQRGGGRAAAAKPLDFYRLVIKPTPAEITLVEGGISLKWKLDGSEESISALGRAGYPKGKAAWDG